VVTADDRLVATGSAVLSGMEMLVFNYGVAVTVRHGRSAHVTGRN
jgi:archaeosine-15-forming tRNA-guanine transglycosylase